MTDEWRGALLSAAKAVDVRAIDATAGRPITLWSGNTFIWAMPSGDDLMRARMGKPWSEWAGEQLAALGERTRH